MKRKNAIARYLVLTLILAVSLGCNSEGEARREEQVKRVVAEQARIDEERVKQVQAAQNALKAIRRIVSATDIGVTYLEYNSRLLDAKADVDSELSSLDLPEFSRFKQEMGLAIECFADARTIWQKADGDEVLADYEPQKSLIEKYSVPTFTRFDFNLFSRSVALSVIWAEAKKHVDSASELLK